MVFRYMECFHHSECIINIWVPNKNVVHSRQRPKKEKCTAYGRFRILFCLLFIYSTEESLCKWLTCTDLYPTNANKHVDDIYTSSCPILFLRRLPIWLPSMGIYRYEVECKSNVFHPTNALCFDWLWNANFSIELYTRTNNIVHEGIEISEHFVQFAEHGISMTSHYSELKIRKQKKYEQKNTKKIFTTIVSSFDAVYL